MRFALGIISLGATILLIVYIVEHLLFLVVLMAVFLAIIGFGLYVIGGSNRRRMRGILERRRAR